MASNMTSIQSVQDLIKSLSQAANNTAANVVKDASNINSNTLSSIKLQDWIKNKGVTIAEDAAKNFKIGNFTIPKELTDPLTTTGGYGSETQYQNIYNNFVQQSKTFAELNAPTKTTETGQYVSPYQEQINTLMEQLKAITPYKTPAELEQYLMNLLQSANQPFSYNPATDEALKIAQQEAGRVIREQAGAKGTLYSSGTIAKTAYQQGVLIPQYEQVAYQRYADQKNREIQMATTLMQWDAQQADRWSDQLKLIQSKADFILQLDQQELEKFQLLLDQRNADKQYQLQLKQFNLEQKMAQIENAYRRVDAIGYVDKETSVILGLPIGQKAQWVKELEQQQKNELIKIQKQFEQEKKLAQEQAKVEKDLIKYKTSIEEASQRKLMKEKYELDKKLAGYQNSMQSGGPIGGSSSGSGYYATGNYSTAASYQTLKNSTGNSQIDSYINKYAKMYGVDANLVRAVMKQESNFNTGARSSVGAIGLMQLMPGTASGLGVNPYNVEQNIKGGVKYLSTYLKKYKSIEKALISYNAGPGRANNSYNSLPSETKNYIKKVMGYYTGGGGGGSVSGSSGSSGGSGGSSSTKQIQTYLNNYGYMISIDGKMGSETKNAIKQFQKLNGLTPDGIVGPKTLAKLQQLGSKKKTTKLPYL